jgi:thiol-disulfide isomerase/thioredoxin
MAASGDWFQKLGILTNFGTPQQAWAQKFAAPAGSLLQPHKLAVELNNNTVSYYIDDVLLQETQVIGWEVGTALKATMKPQVTSGKSNAEDTPHQKPAPNSQQASIPQKFDLNDLIGDNLIDANGNPIDSATLKNKFIGIYFSAHWCGPCRQFTPKLVEFRNQIADEFEVVFASADQDAPAMLSYMKEAAMPWPALPFASPKISSLNRTFQIRSIPTFVVLDPTGRLASPNARNDVTTLSPKDALSKWKIDAEKAAPPKPALVPPPVLSSTSENPPKDTSIVPGKSLLGCPIGSTEEEVVKKLGKPMANFRFGENATALLYYNGTALLRFHNGKLLDGNFSVSSQLRINPFHEHEVTAYSLPNGISIGNTLQKAKEILTAHKDKVQAYIQSAEQQGAKIVVDGRDAKPTGYEKGFFVGPTLIDQVTPNMTSYQQEIFGPVLQVMRVNTMQEAMQLINDHEYGNGTCIYTRDGEAARYFSSHIQVGMVGINVPLPVPVAYHSFGGWKRSLFGDLHAYGPDGVRFYTRRKTITQRWPSAQVREAKQFSMPTLN